MTSCWNNFTVIARGANRICVEHPDNPKLCIKFDLESEHAKGGLTNRLRRQWARWVPNNSFAEQEHRRFNTLKSRIGSAATEFFTEVVGIVDTQYGKGLVCRRALNSDGTSAQPIHHYYTHENDISLDQLVAAIESFGNCLLQHDIPLFDLNAGNLMVLKNRGNITIICVDIKSLGVSKEIIPLSVWFRVFRQKKLTRRIDRLVKAVRSRKK